LPCDGGTDLQRTWRGLIYAVLIALVAGPALAQDIAPGEPGGQGAPLPATDGDVLAQGAAGAFTRDVADAYIEALEFTLSEIGQSTTFDAGQREQIQGALAAGFPDLPAEVQVDLVNVRPLWTRLRAAWGTLPSQGKQEFAYYILALAYGEQAAPNALGLNAGDAEQSGGGDYKPSVDDLLGSVPGTTDCWSSAGCTGYDPGTGTYTYED
jgi:hypothetical protein